jgi:hypothetical protein
MPIVVDKKSLNAVNISRFNTVVQDCISNGNITAENVEIFQSISAQVQRHKTNSNQIEYEKNIKLISEVMAMDVKPDFLENVIVDLDEEMQQQIPHISSEIQATKRNTNTVSGQVTHQNGSESTDTTSGERIQVLLQDQKVIMFLSIYSKHLLPLARCIVTMHSNQKIIII